MGIVCDRLWEWRRKRGIKEMMSLVLLRRCLFSPAHIPFPLTFYVFLPAVDSWLASISTCAFKIVCGQLRARPINTWNCFPTDVYLENMLAGLVASWELAYCCSWPRNHVWSALINHSGYWWHLADCVPLANKISAWCDTTIWKLILFWKQVLLKAASAVIFKHQIKISFTLIPTFI